jgi:hypothetical protein
MTPSAITAKQITTGYAQMAMQYETEGWNPSLLTFMFQQLPGSRASVGRQMEREVERVYSRFVTRVVRNPRSAFQVGRLPVWLCSPDFPVFKYTKQTLDDVTVNDGEHMHAIALQPPWSRLDSDLDVHFEECQGLYVRPEFPLLRIDARPITHDLNKVVEYALKAMRRGIVGRETTLILPRSRTEMP